ncbi:tripartite tricarboxylate transporter substrate binding protein [Variovorax sp. KK3]|uniref:tripartite tricarboxylate transporter substrate binding protein n=1 Tax=Variovorax sp. KK3 TaxID=1855728 RepID=UPI00097CB52C|nr:tripartite tricarboxylate transporter substrate binding protein [Variovorax sp. KK3]
MRSTTFAAAAALCTALLSPAGHAQNFPEGPVRLVIPTTPGSTPDLLARTIAPKLSERIGRPVVVDNRVGASGNIGTEAVVRASPNGSTLLIAASSLATGAPLQKGLPFDAGKDLAPVTLMGWSRLVFVTHPGAGVKTINDFLAAVRKSPGRLSYGSPGNGTPNHLAAELFKAKTQTFIMHIPYRGSAQQLTDVLGGQIDMAPLTAIAAAPHVRSGKLVPLAITGDKRSPVLPGVPSMAESGLPGVDGNIWYGMFAPKGTPPELVARLNREVHEILREEEKALTAQGFEVEVSTPAEFGDRLARDTARWTELVRQQNIKPD